VFPGELQFAQHLTPVLRYQVDFYYNEVKAGTANMPDPDWATPDMGSDIDAELQLLMAGKITPQQYVDAVQSDETSFRSTLTSG
jgi:hypothetical protein